MFGDKFTKEKLDKVIREVYEGMEDDSTLHTVYICEDGKLIPYEHSREFDKLMKEKIDKL